MALVGTARSHIPTGRAKLGFGGPGRTLHDELEASMNKITTALLFSFVMACAPGNAIRPSPRATTTRLGRPLLAGPLPPDFRAGRPCHLSQPAGQLPPAGRYVDAFIEVLYDIDLGSQHGETSKWLKVVYDDRPVLFIHIDDISDETLIGMELVRVMIDEAALCEGGRVFPGRMNRSTTPRL
jgi:hypothetical protein